jgi:SAM-dependent methyltransferase
VRRPPSTILRRSPSSRHAAATCSAISSPVLPSNAFSPCTISGIAFAQQWPVPGRFVCGTAVGLPFRDAVFDFVLCRDVLHHLEDPRQALRELRRVVRPGGQVWIVEPNGRNPLVAFLSLVRPHERGQLRNSIDSIRALVNEVFSRHRLEVRQPLPLSRVLLHYQFGWPGLGRTRAGAALLDGCESLLRAIWPHPWWAYIVVQAEREEPDRDPLK